MHPGAGADMMMREGAGLILPDDGFCVATHGVTSGWGGCPLLWDGHQATVSVDDSVQILEAAEVLAVVFDAEEHRHGLVSPGGQVGLAPVLSRSGLAASK